MNRSTSSKWVRLTACLALVALLAPLAGGAWPRLAAASPQAAPAPAAELAMQQFSAGGHVLGALPSGVTIASTSHALRVEFVGANDVQPQASQREQNPSSAPEKGAAQPLDAVVWRNLWDGISLSYRSAPGGIAESVYTLEPGAAVENIRLRYNAPATLGGDGALTISFENGQMTETAPLAWQEIGGQRVAVAAAFTLGELVGFSLGAYDPAYPVTIDPTLTWTSFVGSGMDDDQAKAIAVDTAGNVYVAGYSVISWGAPQRIYTNLYDAFVVKLDSSGALQWNTFLGGWGNDQGHGVAVDPSGNVYVAGMSDYTWGSPVRSHAGATDGWAAKLNANGALQWSTFFGSFSNDSAYAIAVNSSGNPYITGFSAATWGTPVAPHAGNYDAFTVKLIGASGIIAWSTFSGGAGVEYGEAIAVSQTTVVIAGRSTADWGTPVQGYSAGYDIFAARLNPTNGALQWNTFLGGAGDEYAQALALDDAGNAYLAGNSTATWGSPTRAYAGGLDGFAAKVDTAGWLVWNSFQGGEGNDTNYGIATDVYGNVYLSGYTCHGNWGTPIFALSGNCAAHVAQLNTSVGALAWNTFLNASDAGSYSTGYAIAYGAGVLHVAGVSSATWQTPLHAFSGSPEAFAAQMSLSGILLWNTFYGGSADDFVLGISVDGAGNSYVTGYSNKPWGDPVNDWWWNYDAFAAKLDANGALVWNTFLGGDLGDFGNSITFDPLTGDVIVVGSSNSAWGSPVRSYSALSDGFVASLDSATGELNWSTFLGGAGFDDAYGVRTASADGSVYITGFSGASWGAPLRAYTAGNDAYAVRLNSNGVLVWNTFLGGAGSDVGYAITLDYSGQPCLTGNSSATWGAPARPFSAGVDAFVVRLNSSGGLAWNSFVGGAGTDEGKAISISYAGNVLIAGNTTAGWTDAAGGVIEGGGGGMDAYVTELQSLSGEMVWTQFVGGAAADYGLSLVTADDGNIYLAGTTLASWAGAAGEAPAGGGEGASAYLTRLNSAGDIIWSTFLGGSGDDYGISVSIDAANYLYVAGYSHHYWGIVNGRGYSSGWDGFVARVDSRLLMFLPLVIR